MNTIQSMLSKFRNNRFFILQGSEGIGKTQTAISRAAYLSNEYCLYNSDNILFITDEDEHYIHNSYRELKENNSNLTFFSAIDNSFEVLSINNLIDKNYNSFRKKTKIPYEAIEDKKVKINIIIQGIHSLMRDYPKSKLLKDKNSTFLLEEIEYIRRNKIETLEAYQNFIRKGRDKKLAKNSSSREAIYSLYIFYDNYLKKNNLIDFASKEALVLKEAQKKTSKRYTHIIIDNSERLTKSQLELIKELFENKSYSNFIIVINEGVSIWQFAYLTNHKAIKDFQCGVRYKVIKLKDKLIEEKPVREEVFINNENLLEEKVALKHIEEEKSAEKKMNNLYMEHFSYYDIRHKKLHDFAVDSSSYKEIILEPSTDGQTIGEEELRTVEVYSDIAAGEPILISDEIEGAFNIPNFWLKGIKDAFMLKVKGDSMIGANIHHGDYVLIRKQSVANNSDIVAVDLGGNATLKRLSIKREGIFLVPENPKYEPIKVESEDAMIIGTAIGVISRK